MSDVTGHEPTQDPSLGQLVGQLSDQTSRLVRDEVKLAKTELQSSVKHAGVGVGLFGGAGLFALLGLITLIGAAVAALSLTLEVWLSALIVGVVLFVIAGIVALIGKKQVGEIGPPERTIDNVKKDIATVKDRRS
ncbi:phage holin family protein [Aeromicrobium sp.]|uniref:phage holin family protein n=1 Tax=Aeromicrobium sp. TaxID=1871063 RepID=UPI0025BD6170|nr:phage holin family protein [Aeromicrobium sp.]